MSDCGSLPGGFLGRSYLIPDYGIAPFTRPHCEGRRYSCSNTVGGHKEPCLCRGNNRIRSQAIKRGGGLWAHHWFLGEDCVNSALPESPCSCRAVLDTDVLFWVIVPFPRAEDRAQTRLMLGEQFANGLVMRLTDQWEWFFLLAWCLSLSPFLSTHLVRKSRDCLYILPRMPGSLKTSGGDRNPTQVDSPFHLLTSTRKIIVGR